MANAYGYDGYGGGPPMGPPMIGPQMPMMPGPGGMDPASNNQPLQFNMNKGKPPMPMSVPTAEIFDHMPGMDNKNKVDMDLEGQDENGMMAPNMSGGSGMMGQWGPMMGGPMMGDPSQMMGDHSHMMGDPAHMMGDPSQMMMGPMGGWGPMGGVAHNMGLMGGLVDPTMPRVPIVLSNNTTLYPPPPTAPPPNTRERPPGCRTIFIGGLPENMTEELLREMCERCGTMTSVRMSKKNFAHIRYEEEMAVERALLVSGYRIKIGNSDEKADTGRLHVDYAQARDDLYEWECQQRALAREFRHRQRIEEDRLRPPSPPPVIHYSDHEAQLLLEKVKGETDETFTKAAEVLIIWMDRGDCNRRSSNIFYSMIQSVNSHVKRLTSEKQTHIDELEVMKQNLFHKLEGILRQFELIEKVFATAAKQKAWDHFSKAQRKNLDTWRKFCSDLVKREQAEFFKERKEDEMEMSDDENSSQGEPNSKKKKLGFNMDEVELRVLKEENTNMRFQLEAYQNEVDLLKAEAKELGAEEKDKQLRMYQQTMQGMQQQLLSAKQDLRDRERELKQKLEELEYENDKLKKVNQRKQQIDIENKKENQSKQSESETDKEVITLDDDKAESEEGAGTEDGKKTPVEEVPTISSSSTAFTDREARLVGLISTFLHVHPFGASVDYIWSYLKRLDIKIRTSEIEDLLENCTSVFRQDVSGVGASIEKRWKFIAFNPY